MDKVDWSKAPEGAQFYTPETDNDYACWWKYEHDRWWCKIADHEDDEWSGETMECETVFAMQPRPQPDNKEGEGVGWDEDGSFPPGGDRCEAYIMADARNQHGPAGKWVAGVSRGKALASNGGWGGIFEADDGVMHFVGAQSYFRPIQSHRDKVIEALCEIANQPGVSSRNVNIDCSVAQRALIEAIADSNEVTVKLPGEEE